MKIRFSEKNDGATIMAGANPVPAQERKITKREAIQRLGIGAVTLAEKNVRAMLGHQRFIVRA